MKKLLTCIATLTLVFALFLTGCVNQGMADKINKKADSEEGYTYAQLVKDYGEPTIDFSGFGLVIYVKGCKDADEVEEKYEDGKELKAVYVSIIMNKVVKAEFKEYAPEK